MNVNRETLNFLWEFLFIQYFDVLHNTTEGQSLKIIYENFEIL